MNRLLILAVIADCFAIAHADHAPPPRHDDETAVWLARLYISESGWSSPDDRAAIFHSISERQRTLREPTLLGAMRRYSRPLFESERDRRRWVQALRVDGGAPGAWPSSLAWGDFADPWKRILDEARGHLASSPENPCDGWPEHWGGMGIAADRDRARRAVESGAWRPLECGEARNRFFEVRRRGRDLARTAEERRGTPPG